MSLRALFLLALFLPCSSLLGQGKAHKIVYIKKDSVQGHKQSIYYDMDRNSRRYKLISDFRFREFDDESYTASLKYLVKEKLALKKRTPVIPITRWVTLKQYKGTFYAYYPCDFNGHFRISINDTTFIHWTGEGPEAARIKDQQKIDDSTYSFVLNSMFPKEERLTIYIIDTVKGIAVFESIYKGAAPYYDLMIAADKINAVPIIVNNCETQKQAELHFETPDHKKLIRNWPGRK